MPNGVFALGTEAAWLSGSSCGMTSVLLILRGRFPGSTGS